MSDNLNRIGIRGSIAARTPDYRYTLPEGGNPGDIPVKTETGVEWQQPEPATTTPDYNQNDETASDYIKNRPGGYVRAEKKEPLVDAVIPASSFELYAGGR